MKNIALIIAVLMLPALVSCGGRKAKQTEQQLKIEIPEVPAMMTDPAAAGTFLANHYWDNMNFADTAYIGKEVTEQAFADYLNLLMPAPRDIAVNSIDAFMTKARVNLDVYNYFTEKAEHYLNDPNSPYRNEDMYIAVLRNIIAWDALDDVYKLRPESQLAMALKNRVGEQATDLVLTLSSGSKIKLYDQKADYTLLYFANPDCNACAQTTAQLNASEVIRQLVDSGEMKVVTVYPDEDLALWNKHLGDLPGDWINTYDAEKQLRGEDLYDLRAIPSLYLLDRDKRVLLKDIPSGDIMHNYFMQVLYR
jgi:hypothetical protein